MDAPQCIRFSSWLPAVIEEAAAPRALDVVEAAAPDALAHALRALQHLTLRGIRHHLATNSGGTIYEILEDNY